MTELPVSYDSERGNAGMAYSITRTSGQFEGYQVLFPQFTLLYSAILGDSLLPQKHSNGNYLINVDIAASGSLGIRDVESAKVRKASFGLTFPLLEGDATVGELAVTSPNGTALEGEVHLSNQQLLLQGTIKNAAGSRMYELKTAPGGELTLQKVDATQ